MLDPTDPMFWRAWSPLASPARGQRVFLRFSPKSLSSLPASSSLSPESVSLTRVSHTHTHTSDTTPPLTNKRALTGSVRKSV